MTMRRRASSSCVEVLAYCFMSNHFHILVYVPDPRELSDDEILVRIRALYSGTALAEIEKEWELLGKIGDVNGRGRFRKRYLRRMWGASEFMKMLLHPPYTIGRISQYNHIRKCLP